MGKKGSDLLFSLDGTLLDRLSFRKAWEYVRREAVKERPNLAKMTFYDFRHVALTQLAAKNVGGAVLGALAGHRDPRSTKVYVNLGGKDVAEAIDAASR
jgi:integrase